MIGVTRVWQITLLVVSPLFIFGGETITLGVVKLFRTFRKRFISLNRRLDYRAFTWFPIVVILIPYFIFNSGAVFELSRSQTTNVIDIPYSIALSSYRLDLNTVFNEQDLAAAGWLCEVPKGDAPVYVDYNSSKLFVNQIDFPCRISGISHDLPKTDSTGYVYLRTWTVQNEKVTFATGYAARESVNFYDLPLFRQIMERANRVYSNGGAQVLELRQEQR